MDHNIDWRFVQIKNEVDQIDIIKLQSTIVYDPNQQNINCFTSFPKLEFMNIQAVK